MPRKQGPRKQGQASERETRPCFLNGGKRRLTFSVQRKEACGVGAIVVSPRGTDDASTRGTDTLP